MKLADIQYRCIAVDYVWCLLGKVTFGVVKVSDICSVAAVKSRTMKWHTLAL